MSENIWNEPRNFGFSELFNSLPRPCTVGLPKMDSP